MDFPVSQHMKIEDDLLSVDIAAKSFGAASGDPVAVLKDLSFKLPAGRFTAIWFDTKTGEEIGREPFTHAGGDWKCAAPFASDGTTSWASGAPNSGGKNGVKTMVSKALVPETVIRMTTITAPNLCLASLVAA